MNLPPTPPPLVSVPAPTVLVVGQDGEALAPLISSAAQRAQQLDAELMVSWYDVRAKDERTTRRAMIEAARGGAGLPELSLELHRSWRTFQRQVETHLKEPGTRLVVVSGEPTRRWTALRPRSADWAIRRAQVPVLVARTSTRSGRILVATDLLDERFPAVQAAAQEAELRGAEMTAVHCLRLEPVFPGPGPGMELSSEPPGAPNDSARERAIRWLDEALQLGAAKAEPLILEGDPLTRVPRLTSEMAAELLVIGTRPKSRWQRLILGSIAEPLAQRVPCSVLVVPLSPQVRRAFA